MNKKSDINPTIRFDATVRSNCGLKFGPQAEVSVNHYVATRPDSWTVHATDGDDSVWLSMTREQYLNFVEKVLAAAPVCDTADHEGIMKLVAKLAVLLPKK